MRGSTRVAILGCGPTGLVAAHAATEAGADVTIYSKPRKSQIYGAQYLHEPIPGVDCGEERTIRYSLAGGLTEYLKKVYGPDSEPDAGLSENDYNTSHSAWDIRLAYDELWARYQDRILATALGPDALGAMVDWNGYDHVISTIPLPSICANWQQHHFDSQAIWALGDSPKKAVPLAVQDDHVLYSGHSSVPWYRASNIFGYKTVEWPEAADQLMMPLGAARVSKPISTTCDCHPHVHRLGRFGMWRRAVLVHQAYAMTTEILTGVPAPTLHRAPCPMSNPDIDPSRAALVGCRCD